MSAPRFHLAPAQLTLAPHTVVALPDAVARHAVHALRLRDGDALVLFDGQGGEYDATLVVVGRAVHAQVDAHRAIEREVAHPCTLVQAIVAADVMDGIVRKAVELGAAAVVPLVTERTQRVPRERVDRRVARWQQIAVAACEQCGRNRVPVVVEPLTLEAWLDATAVDQAVLLHPAAQESLARIAAQAAPGAVVIGPEGGFSAVELERVEQRGMRRARLGASVLRADTAAIAALATLNAVAVER